jgi:hypothetical protein
MFWVGIVALLLALSIFAVPLVVILVDWLEPLRRICPECKRRGVTQGNGQIFIAEYEYDSWQFCRHCHMFFTGVDGKYAPLGRFKV